MEEIKTVLICGMGAIGSVYANAISDFNNDILSVLVDKDRLKKYQDNPPVFNGKTLNLNYITPDNTSLKADLILIATKNNTIGEVLKNIENFVKQDTIILSLLNGLQSEDILAEKFGFDKILYSYYIGHTSTRNGREVIHDGIYKTVFGEKDNTNYSKNVIKLKNFFDKVGIPYEIPTDMEYSRWWKFLVNVGYNQASSVLNSSYKYFQNCPKVNNFAVKLMEEAVSIAIAQGVKNTHLLIPEVLKVISTMLPETKTSMLQDIDACRPTEIDAFAGYIVTLGEKHNIKTPYNRIVYDIIKALEEKNSYTKSCN